MVTGSGLTRPKLALTAKAIEALAPDGVAYRVPDERCIGLAVRVGPNGMKTWDLSFRVHGQGTVKRLSLGRVDDLSLGDARARANDLTSAARRGRDIVEEERKAVELVRSRATVRELIEEYVRRRVRGRLRTALEIERRLYRALASRLDHFAGDLRRRDIRILLDAVADDGFAREAEKRRQTIGAMFRWALSQDNVEINPTTGLTAYGAGTPGTRVLSPEEIGSVWDWLESGEVPQNHAYAMKLQLLTGARCGEVAGVCAEEIDTAEWTWTLPAARSKNGKSRITPLVGIARRIIEDRLLLVRTGALYRTEAGTPLRSVNVAQSLWARRNRLPVSKFTTHDLRRTVATQLAELGTPFDVIAIVIGHEAGTRETKTLVRHYVRTDLLQRKREVLQAWDRWIDGVISNGHNA